MFFPYKTCQPSQRISWEVWIAGAQIVRECSSKKVFFAGSIGLSDENLEPLGGLIIRIGSFTVNDEFRKKID